MATTLSLEVSDALFAALGERARAMGMSPAAVAAASLEWQFGVSSSEGAAIPPDQSDEPASRIGRFETLFGSVDLGYPLGADNDAIDADLAREYAGARDSS